MRKFSKYFMIAATVCLTVMIMASHVHAILISIDYAVEGDSLITRDTDTRLDWLDLTVTLGLSYNEVADQLGGGGQYHPKWRYATWQEVEGLMVNAGIPETWGGGGL